MEPISRRAVLLAGGAAVAATPLWAKSSPSAPFQPDLVAWLPDGVLQVTALSDRAFRVRFVPIDQRGAPPPASPVLQPIVARRNAVRSSHGDTTRLDLPFIRCEVDAQSTVRFFDRDGRLLLAEAVGTRRLTPARLYDETTHTAELTFDSPADEYLFGTGCFQDGALNLRSLPRRLTQVNTQISQPFLLSSKGYGLLWHNLGMSELNMPVGRLNLTKVRAGEAHISNVTTTSGNAQVSRRTASFEGELTVVIGTRGRHVPQERALEHVFGYTCGNDVSDRLVQRRESAFGCLLAGKGYDSFAPIGPYIATGIDPSDQRIITRVNGVVRQDGNSRDLVFSVPYLIAYISRFMTLLPGDLIMTGTPAGVGPLAVGDVVEVEIPGIGVLRNPVQAAGARRDA